MNFSVCLALIHNNNVLRNAYIQPQLEKLFGSMGESDILAKKIEVAFQPEIRPHSIAMAFMRDVMYRMLGRKWQRYRLLKPRALLPDVISFLKGSLIKYIVEREKGKQWKKNSAIEVILTDKHIRAWQEFLDTDADFLICFEDDAVFKDDSHLKINNLLNTLAENHQNMPCYIDLGGGCQLCDLMIDHLEENQDELYKYYRKPVTNTTCAYLMNRQLVVIFHDLLIRKPWLRLIGADWMINSLFIQMANKGMQCFCMHAYPTIVKHGTTTGEYVSSFDRN